MEGFMFEYTDLYAKFVDLGLDHPVKVWIGCANTGCGGTHGELARPARQVKGIDPLELGVPAVVISSDAFGSLKGNLQAALEAEIAREAAQDPSPKLQGLAEIEMLEAKLTQALEELRARKADLQNRAA
jgi:hypothetical protein